MTITNYLHFGGDAIELGGDTDIEALIRRIYDAPSPSWSAVSDTNHNQHRLRVSTDASIRISTVHRAAPAVPRSVPQHRPERQRRRFLSAGIDSEALRLPGVLRVDQHYLID